MNDKYFKFSQRVFFKICSIIVYHLNLTTIFVFYLEFVFQLSFRCIIEMEICFNIKNFFGNNWHKSDIITKIYSFSYSVSMLSYFQLPIHLMKGNNLNFEHYAWFNYGVLNMVNFQNEPMLVLMTKSWLKYSEIARIRILYEIMNILRSPN